MENNKKLWNPDSFVWLSAIFSFYPAAIMCSMNWGKMGLPEKRKKYFILYTLGFIALIVVLIYIPLNYAKGAAIGLNIGLGYHMRIMQKPMYEQHVRENGKASILWPLVICIAMSALVIWFMVNFNTLPDNDIDVNGNKIYYTDTVSKNEAVRLGDFMTANKIFNDENKMDLKLDKKQGFYIVSFVVSDKRILQNSRAKDTFKEIAKQLSKTVFNNATIEIELCDEYFKCLEIVE